MKLRSRNCLNRLMPGVALGIFLCCSGCQLNPFAGGMNPFSHSSLSITPGSINAISTTVDFTTAVYGFDQQRHLTVVLIEGPTDNPKSAATLRLFWRPKTGSTPIDKTATNATLRYIIFEDDSHRPITAIYAGAGFLNPRSREGADTFVADLWQANLRLADATLNFKDPFGISEITGKISATRDDLATLRLIKELQQRVSERLGHPRLVSAKDHGF